MLDSLQTEFIAQCRALQKQAHLVKSATLDLRDKMWCCMPVFDDLESTVDLANTQPSSEAWFRLADTISDISMDKTESHHGILLTDQTEMLTLIEHFNKLKLDIAKTSAALKKQQLNDAESAQDFSFQGDSLESYTVVRDEFLSKGRDREIHTMLRNHHVEQINFKKATKLIKVTEPSVTRFRYVWSATHYRKRVIHGEEFFTLVKHYRNRLNNEHLADFLEEDLAEYKIGPTTKLFRFAFTRPVLKANYKVATDEGNHWKCCLASGIVVIPQQNIPALLWQTELNDEEVAQAHVRWKAKSKLDQIILAGNLEVYRER